MSDKQILFQIIAEGRVYTINADGSIEGFGPQATVINNFPQLARQSVLNYRKAEQAKANGPR